VRPGEEVVDTQSLLLLLELCSLAEIGLIGTTAAVGAAVAAAVVVAVVDLGVVVGLPIRPVDGMIKWMGGR
jgi:hypothetical protein